MIGLILVDHGSTRQEANDMLLGVVALFKRVSDFTIVEPAHMEIAEPTIRQAFDACVRQGATVVLVHPYFLAPGRHSSIDIPRIVTQAASKYPSVEFHVTQPLGLDEKIARVIVDRVHHCIEADFCCDQCTIAGECGAKPAQKMSAA